MNRFPSGKNNQHTVGLFNRTDIMIKGIAPFIFCIVSGLLTTYHKLIKTKCKVSKMNVITSQSHALAPELNTLLKCINV